MANSCMLSRSTPPLDASFSSQKSFSNSASSLHVSLVPCSKFLGVALCNAPLPRSTSSPPSLVAWSSSLPNLRSSQTRTQYVIKSIDETNHTSTFYTILKAHINMLICVNGIRNRSSSRESMIEALIYLFQMVCKTTKPGRKDEESSQEYGDRNVLEFLYSMFKEAIERGATVRSTHDAHGCSPSLIYGQSQANVKNNTTDDDSFIISMLCQTDGRYAVTSTLAGYTDIDAGKEKLNRQIIIFDGLQRWCCNVLFPTLISSTASSYILGPAHAEITTPEINMVYGELGAGVELGVQVLYLAALLGLVGVASYFVVKQVLIRRDLETAARDLQVSCEDW
ncbi:hypothetical protein KP509_03G019100 [Ceratopteris richardii]|uniref:Uncharacterized protein n=1 Tax=Ceratopteris richardii TaxID=49495 RepID=A0A8T2V4I9_CERRI|nr:hypothetical protein KP509_03G019100 [Ceratopteris richardii]